MGEAPACLKEKYCSLRVQGSAETGAHGGCGTSALCETQLAKALGVLV